MRNRLFTLFFLSLSLFSYSQTVKWERVYGAREYEYGRSVQQTADGGYIVAGTSSSYGAATDMYLLKLRADGSFRWHKVYGGGNDEWAYSVKQTPSDGGYIICGFSNTWGNSGYDVYLVKTDSLGNELWAKTYGGSDWDFGYSVDITSDGGYIIAGSTYSYGAGGEDAFLVKTDSDGIMQWFDVYGGFSDDNATEVHQCTDGGYILSGRTKSFSVGDYDMWLIKTTPTGDTAWTRTFGTVNEDGLNSVKQTPDGGYVTAGYTYNGPSGDVDGYIIKTDGVGAVQAVKNDSVPVRDTWLESVWPNTDGTYFTVGYYSVFSGAKPDYFFAKWDAFLNYMPCCNSSRGGLEEDMAYCGQQTSDKGFIIVGNTNSWGNGKSDIYIVKLDSNFAYTNAPLVGINPVEKPGANELNLYPVPADEQLFFETDAGRPGEHVHVTITDLSGRVVMEVANPPSRAIYSGMEFSIPVNSLSEGMYILKVSTPGKMYAGRFMVKH